jgi:hypothetical protein
MSPSEAQIAQGLARAAWIATGEARAELAVSLARPGRTPEEHARLMSGLVDALCGKPVQSVRLADSDRSVA